MHPEAVHLLSRGPCGILGDVGDGHGVTVGRQRVDDRATDSARPAGH